MTVEHDGQDVDSSAGASENIVKYLNILYNMGLEKSASNEYTEKVSSCEVKATWPDENVTLYAGENWFILGDSYYEADSDAELGQQISYAILGLSK